MATKQTAPRFINGTAKSRATSTDYMAALLESVTVDDWRDVVTATVALAKSGDASARARARFVVAFDWPVEDAVAEANPSGLPSPNLPRIDTF